MNTPEQMATAMRDFLRELAYADPDDTYTVEEIIEKLAMPLTDVRNPEQDIITLQEGAFVTHELGVVLFVGRERAFITIDSDRGAAW